MANSLAMCSCRKPCQDPKEKGNELILQTERRNVWQILAMCGKIARMIMFMNQFCRQREEMCGKFFAMCGKIAKMIMSMNYFCRQRGEMCGNFQPCVAVGKPVWTQRKRAVEAK